MISFTKCIFLTILISKWSSSQRRIVNGHRVFEDIRFMVYMVRSSQSIANYTGWLCGGCIVHPLFILTSASCLEDVSHLYAIAGYRRYIRSENIDHNTCTGRMKKRIVSFCFHPTYDMVIERNDYWNWIDIALARVETPFDFRDDRYNIYCNYKPNLIPVSFIKEFQAAGRDVVTYGWGSTRYYRPLGDENDYNADFMRYASAIIMDKNECRKAFRTQKYEAFRRHTQEIWICTYDKEGRLNANGSLVKSVRDKSLSQRRSYVTINNSEIRDNETSKWYSTRRHDICQNDHGGPLVTWVGGKPMVIGVATAFLVDKHMQCRGPYVYTSTYCNSKFINCVLESQRSRRSSACTGISINEKEMSWS